MIYLCYSLINFVQKFYGGGYSVVVCGLVQYSLYLFHC